MAASSQQTTVSSLPEVIEITVVNKITHLNKRSQGEILITAKHYLVNRRVNSDLSSSVGAA